MAVLLDAHCLPEERLTWFAVVPDPRFACPCLGIDCFPCLPSMPPLLLLSNGLRAWPFLEPSPGRRLCSPRSL